MYSRPKFFLGANSGTDFVSYFKELQERESSMQLFILKGGPGSGKSTLMKRVMQLAAEKGNILEVIPCASDPSSLDAFIDHTQGFAMMDGTAPHTEDPLLPGVRHHILYTGDLWDTVKLAQDSKPIEKLNKKVSDCHKGAGAYIKSATALLRENKRLAEDFLLQKKALSYADSIIKMLSGKKEGKVIKRLLSAVSVGKTEFFDDTVHTLADKIFVLEDRWGAASELIMKTVSFSAKLKGENFIYCPCSIMPEKCDHLIFPDSRIALVTKNPFLDFKGGVKDGGFYTKIDFEEDMLLREKEAEKLLVLASSLVEKAKVLHDELEAYYRKAMDFSKMDILFDKIVSRFYN